MSYWPQSTFLVAWVEFHRWAPHMRMLWDFVVLHRCFDQTWTQTSKYLHSVTFLGVRWRSVFHRWIFHTAEPHGAATVNDFHAFCAMVVSQEVREADVLYEGSEYQQRRCPKHRDAHLRWNCVCLSVGGLVRRPELDFELSCLMLIACSRRSLIFLLAK